MKNPPTFLILVSFLILFFSSTQVNSQVPILPTIYCQNAWNLNVTDPSDEDTIWPRAHDAGVRYMRVGGIELNFRPLYSFQTGTLNVTASDVTNLVHLIDTLRGCDIEPIIEVGFNPVCSDTVSSLGGKTLTQQATIAANVVDIINNTLYTNKRIKYWIISNEPDQLINCHPDSLKGFNYTSLNYADTIATYIRTFSQKMKDKDSTILIIGPELSKFGNDSNWVINKIMSRLISSPSNSYSLMGLIPGTGKYYVDALSFHYYPQEISSKADVVNDPTASHDGFKYRVNPTPGHKSIIDMIQNNSTGRTVADLKIACTEFNLDLNYLESTGDESINYSNVIDSIDNRSFIASQWMAEVYGEAMGTFDTVGGTKVPWIEIMAPWSVKEGDCNRGLGFISNCTSGTINGRKRPMYHVYKMLSENFYGTYYPIAGLALNGAPAQTYGNNGIKSFASVNADTGSGVYFIKIMLINKNDDSYNYTVKFDSAYSVPSGQLSFDFSNLNSHPFLQNTLLANTHWENTSNEKLQANSVLILTFDCLGNFIYKNEYTQADAEIDNPPHFMIAGGTGIDPHYASCGYRAGTHGSYSSGFEILNDTIFVDDSIMVSNSAIKIHNSLVLFARGKGLFGTNCKLDIHKSVLMGCDGNRWEGIKLMNNYGRSETVKIDSSTIANADVALRSDKSSNVDVFQSVFADGDIGIELNSGRSFSIRNNIIGGYAKGIKTSSTQKYNSLIKDNLLLDVKTGMDFYQDAHDSLSIICNKVVYKGEAIVSREVDLKEQGDSLQSAGNRFVWMNFGTPLDYIDHTGSPTQYYYGPQDALAFSYPFVSNIPTILSASDKVCSALLTDPCDIQLEVAPAKSVVNRQIKISPNPSKGLFIVELPNPSATNSALKVYDVMGREVSILQIRKGELNTTLELRTPGLYFVAVDFEGAVLTKKIVVQQ